MPGSKLLALLLLCLALPAQAQVYTWVDENGQKHFGNQPPTPEKQVEIVKIRPGYESDGAQPAVVEETTDLSQEDPAEGDDLSPRQMCSAAVKWTAVDMANLKDIAREKWQAGQITQKQHSQAATAFDQFRSVATVPNCLTSEGKDRELFVCLSKGLGIMVCSGALEKAIQQAFGNL